MTGETKTPVYMDEAEAKLYVQFCQYYPSIKVLIDSDVFNVRNATIELHTQENVIMDVYIKLHPYNKKKQEIEQGRKFANTSIR